MADSVYAICKAALSRLGTETNFTAFGDNTPEARMLEVAYDPARRSVLRAHPWAFAIKRVELALEASTPSFEYTYSFALPADCLLVRRTDYEALGYDHDYRVEGKSLLTDDSAVKIEYIADITDTSKFDPLFDDALSQRIAAELAPALTDNATLAEKLWDIYGSKIQEARSVDAQGKGRPRDVAADLWVMSRL